jgi:hypothetical protein
MFERVDRWYTAAFSPYSIVASGVLVKALDDGVLTVWIQPVNLRYRQLYGLNIASCSTKMAYWEVVVIEQSWVPVACREFADPKPTLDLHIPCPSLVPVVGG